MHLRSARCEKINVCSFSLQASGLGHDQVKQGPIAVLWEIFPKNNDFQSVIQGPLPGDRKGRGTQAGKALHHPHIIKWSLIHLFIQQILIDNHCILVAFSAKGITVNNKVTFLDITKFFHSNGRQKKDNYKTVL